MGAISSRCHDWPESRHGPFQPSADPTDSAGAGLRAFLEARRAGQKAKPPLEARVLQSVMDASEVPYRCAADLHLLCPD